MMNMTRLNTFLNTMDDWSKVIETFADSSRFAGFIWGPRQSVTAGRYSSPTRWPSR